MKTLKFIYIVWTAAMLSACAAVQPENPIQSSNPIVDSSVNRETSGNLIIFYHPEAGSDVLMKAVRKYGATVIYEYRNFNGIAIRLPEGADMEKAVSHFRAVKGVLSVKEDGVVQLHH